jgi:peptidoglycan hydrolase CwlO-like protein
VLKELKKILKTKDEKELESATSEFDELMGKVDDDQKDLTQLERHMREEWGKIHKEVDDMTEDVDGMVDRHKAQ